MCIRDSHVERAQRLVGVVRALRQPALVSPGAGEAADVQLASVRAGQDDLRARIAFGQVVAGRLRQQHDLSLIHI